MAAAVVYGEECYDWIVIQVNFKDYVAEDLFTQAKTKTTISSRILCMRLVICDTLPLRAVT